MFDPVTLMITIWVQNICKMIEMSNKRKDSGTQMVVEEGTASGEAKQPKNGVITNTAEVIRNIKSRKSVE